MNKKRSMSTEKMVFVAIMTALVLLLQTIGSGIKFGIFSISFVLVPIVIGSAISGPTAGAWLGFIFGAVVFYTDPTAQILWGENPFATILIVFGKGILAGLATGLFYTLFVKLNKYIAVFLSAVICPVVNTAIFLLGCRIFFYHRLVEWSTSTGHSSVTAYVVFGILLANFLPELIVNLILSPAILRLIQIKKIHTN